MHPYKKKASPHDVVNQFFDAFSLATAEDYLLSSFKAAESMPVWKKSAPYDLIYFFEQLANLIHAFSEKVNRKNDKNQYAKCRKCISKYTVKQWDEYLHYILSFALSNNSLSEAGVQLELIHLFDYLNQLLATSYLLKS
jgi:hypothetical protein